jgi:hypothetical protein
LPPKTPDGFSFGISVESLIKTRKVKCIRGSDEKADSAFCVFGIKKYLVYTFPASTEDSDGVLGTGKDLDN